MSRSPTNDARRQDLAHFRTVMVVLSVGTVLVGALLGVIHEWLALSLDEARLVASVFLLAGFADTLVLCFWDRLFRDPPA